MLEKKRPIIIDTDPGIDDAAAIVIALRNSQLDVQLLSTVAANVDVEKTTLNALRLVEFLNVDVPVAKGCAQPLLREREGSACVHGESGMAGYDFPEVTRKPLEKHSVEVMREMLMNSEEKMTLVVIGAQTNIAILLRMYPEVKEHIEEIVMMGGSLSCGNMTSLAEFNIYTDPHAASIVFQSGLKISMIGLDITMKALLHRENCVRMRDSGKEGAMLYAMFEKYRGGSLETGLAIHDACAIAYMLRPEMFRMEEKYVEVVTDGIAAGALVTYTKYIDHPDKKPNINVCVDIDAGMFEKWFVGEFE